jgi:rhamnogalacturonyl hydrolase YesR
LDISYPDPTKDIAELVNFLTTDEGYEGNVRTGPNLAAMCWADELAEATGTTKWSDLLLKVANTYERVEKGTAPKPCDPVFGCEDMFFISAMCGRAYKLTGDHEYLNSYTNFLLDANIQQSNGLFWHSRNAPYYWGRGNGFAALAYAEGISYLPEDNPARSVLIEIHSKQMQGLSDVQQPTGMWTQLLDFEGTYQEMSVTCMVGYALARGIRKGWLGKDLTPVLEKAWDGVNKRISDDADLVDVCTGTGFQESRESYLYRAAEYGYDDRGGSMAIWFATELERLHRSDS